MTEKIDSVRVKAIAANLAALDRLLLDACSRSAEARDLIERGECDGAIGTVLDMDRALDDAKALYGAAIALHRLKQI
jgi:hypothetical protein